MIGLTSRRRQQRTRALSLVTAAVAGLAGNNERKTMTVACGAHALHDGYTDLLYVLLPLWQAEFGLGYAEIGLLRALYTGSMAGLQVPAGLLAGRIGGPLLLTLGTAFAGAGYLIAGVSAGFPLLVAALVVGGVGSAVQHPIASSLVAQAFEGQRSRGALAGYNFSGDLGKMALPALTAGLVGLMAWRSATLALGLLGIAAAVAILLSRLTPEDKIAAPAKAAEATAATSGAGHGFPLLLAIGVIDSATRMGFLTFLPFLLRGKGAELATIGLALTLVFAGGAAGKLVCGFLGARIGVIPAVFLTEGLTALGILVLLPLPLLAALAVLPLIGVALNGTSSVLYGTVPELVTPEKRHRAFSIFYTGTIGAGALAPVLYGLASDAVGVPVMMILVAAFVMATLPLAWALRAPLQRLDRAAPTR
jgi:FSR family fosmidomycin resistance protein-like MFS transporter